MNFWLFHGNPTRWRIFDYVRDNGVESMRRTEWDASRYLRDIRAGDRAALWIAGDPTARGVYAVGSVVGEPYRQLSGDDYWTDPGDRRREFWFVDLEFPQLLFEEPILAIDLRRDPRFASATILRIPRGANPHRLSKNEWKAILDHCPA
jgi:predicted RNA-binding protein with PUA-like domain